MEGSRLSRNIPQKEIKALFMLSGGVCAFPGCGKRLIEPGTQTDDATILAEMAHIVADSRQGPRGDSAMSEEDRDKHTNLLLVCGEHHKLIDDRPRTYSIPVLGQMKADHEDRIHRAVAPASEEPKPPLKQERIHSSLLAVTHLPEVVFSAPCAFRDHQDDQVKERLRYPEGDHDQLIRFILREGKLFTFHNLHDPKGPFADVIDCHQVVPVPCLKMWDDAEGHRRFNALMNKALFKHTARLGVRFDPVHRRYYFPATEPGKPRKICYRPLNAKRRSRNVVFQPKRRSTGEPRGYWSHLAVGLRFCRMAEKQWCLSLRPEFHLTKDGETVLDLDQIGRRVTSKKSRMRNYKYLGEVNFWRDYLSNGSPHIVLNFGDQSAVIGSEFLPFDVSWPGVPGDHENFKNLTYPEDLFSTSVLNAAMEGTPYQWDSDNAESEETNGEDLQGCTD
jgi:hypothetical protein